MIIDLTTAWSGPYTVTVAEMVQSLSGTMVLFLGAGPPSGAGSVVLDGRRSLAPGQVFWARASDASGTARFARSPL